MQKKKEYVYQYVYLCNILLQSFFLQYIKYLTPIEEVMRSELRWLSISVRIKKKNKSTQLSLF